MNRNELLALVSRSKPASSDERRTIYEPVNGDFDARRLDTFEFKEPVPIGNHFHEQSDELFFIVSGSIRTLALADIDSNESVILENLGPYTRIRVPRRVAHAMIPEPGTVMVCLATEPFNEAKQDLNPCKLL